MAEVLLRLAGFRPWAPERPDLVVTPGGSLFEADARLGYRQRAGRYEVDQEGLRFVVTHGEDSLRVTHLGKRQRRPELWIFGGSFTYGWGVGDAQTFPWRIQAWFPGVEVLNFGVSGYGTLHSLIQLEDAVEERGAPLAAIVAYASFHDRRNVGSRDQLKNIAAWDRRTPLGQPRARLDEAGQLEIDMTDAVYREFPGMRWLAGVHLLEQLFDELERLWLQESEVEFAILERMSQLARRNGFPLIVAGLTDDAATARLLARGAGSYRPVDISHDWRNPRYNHLPLDLHPNAVGQRLYAAALAGFLRNEGIARDASFE